MNSKTLQAKLTVAIMSQITEEGLSLEYNHKWKAWSMELGPDIPAIRASGRRTSDNVCTGWPTPQHHDSIEQGGSREMTESGRIKTHTGSSVSANLPLVAKLAGWPTPDCSDNNTRPNKNGGATMRDVANLCISGPDSTSSHAETENRGALNPNHSRWLMGFPLSWTLCGMLASLKLKLKSPKTRSR